MEMTNTNENTANEYLVFCLLLGGFGGLLRRPRPALVLLVSLCLRLLRLLFLRWLLLAARLLFTFCCAIFPFRNQLLGAPKDALFKEA